MRQPKVGQEEGGGQFDAAEVIGGTFNLTVAPAVLSERAAFHHATASGRSAPELDMESKASAELAALWRWTRGQLRQSTGGPVALADARA